MYCNSKFKISAILWGIFFAFKLILLSIYFYGGDIRFSICSPIAAAAVFLGAGKDLIVSLSYVNYIIDFLFLVIMVICGYKKPCILIVLISLLCPAMYIVFVFAALLGLMFIFPYSLIFVLPIICFFLVISTLGELSES